MSDAWQQRSRAILIGASAIYVLSLCLWFMWVGMLFIGPDRMVPLLGLAWLTTLSYPIVMVVSLLMSWWLQKQQQYKKALGAVFVPLLYAPFMLVLGFAAFWQVTS